MTFDKNMSLAREEWDFFSWKIENSSKLIEIETDWKNLKIFVLVFVFDQIKYNKQNKL